MSLQRARAQSARCRWLLLALGGCANELDLEGRPWPVTAPAASTPAPADGAPPYSSKRRLREPTPPALDRDLIAALAGEWEGSLEAALWEGASRRLRLSVEDDGSAEMVFGDELAPDARLRPGDPYPLEHYADEPLDGGRVFDGVAAGFRYPVRIERVPIEGHYTGYPGTPVFRANSFDLFEPWCQLMRPVPGSDTCAVEGHAVPVGDGVHCDIYALQAQGAARSRPLSRQPCVEFDLCTQRCACDATRCGAWQLEPPDIELHAYSLPEPELEGEGEEFRGWLSLEAPVALAQVTLRKPAPTLE